jgi:hypothetical protein
MHEEEDNERSFENGDGEGDDDVQAREVLIEVDLGGGNGEDGADHECAENHEIDFG